MCIQYQLSVQRIRVLFFPYVQHYDLKLMFQKKKKKEYYALNNSSRTKKMNYFSSSADNATAATITTGSPPEYRPLSSSSMSQLPSELPGCTPNYTNITITDPKVGFGSRYERQNALNSIADSSSRSDTVESTLPSSTQQQKAAVDDCTNLQNSNSRTLTMLARQRRLVLGYGSRQHRQYHHQKPLMARKLQNQRQEFHETTQVRIPPKSTGGGHGGETELPG